MPLSKKSKPTRVMIFGTFDIIHPGHIHFFKQARSLAGNSFLIVSVARDRNVARIKGKRPQNSESKRKRALIASGLVDKVVLSALKNHLPHILKERPDIIALGYDQTHYTKNLKLDLAKRGLSVKIRRLKPHKPHRYKTSKLI